MRDTRRKPPHASRYERKIIGFCTVTRKHQHPTRTAAKEAVRRLVLLGRDQAKPGQDGPLGAYRCEHCQFWHIGHDPRNAR